MIKVTIIIPAFNEEKRIGKTLVSYSNYFEKLKTMVKIDYEILIVINNTTDRTEEIVKSYQKLNKKIKYLNFKQKGKGFAVIQGFKEALRGGNNLIGFVDADMSTSPEEFYKLIKNIKNFDGVIASRWKPGAIIKTKQTVLRRVTSKGFNFLVRSILFLPYKDTQCGAKLFKREPLHKIVDSLGSTQWAFDIDLLYKLKKNKFYIREIPTVWEDRAGSTINLLKTPFKMFSSILRLRLLNSPFSLIVKAYDNLPERIKIHNF